MKKFINLLFFFCLTIAGTVSAQNVPAEMLIRLGTVAYQQRTPNEMLLTVKHTDFLTDNGDTLMALLHFDNGGFILMSAEAAVTPVLGYSFTDDLLLDDMAPSLQNWLNDYKIQIKQVREKNLVPTTETEAEWQALFQTTKNSRSVVVGPLIVAKWNQSQYYNDLCPADEDSPYGYGGHVPCGCVALAMAMVIHYYRYPVSGQSSHSYYSNYGYHSVVFGMQTYNYEAMPYNLTRRCNEVARLIYHCGVAVDMGYAADGSGAQTEDTKDALKNYYKYDSEISFTHRNGWGGNYSDSQWIDLLKSDLNQNRPIIHSGCSEDGCHAFLCDGYDSDNLFHFNWGWGGSGNGYFSINNLHSGNGDFNYDHRIVYKIHPPENTYPTYCQSKTITNTYGSIEDGSGHLDYLNNTDCTYIIAPTNGKSVTVTMVDLHTEENADFVNVYDGDPENGGNLLHSFSGTTFNPSESFYSPTGVAYITFHTNGATVDQGWRLRFTAKRNVQCNTNKTFTTATGSFTDGSGDEEYASDASCSWKIAPTNATYVNLNFTQFDLSPEDYVTIYKGASLSALTEVGTYTGSSLPSAVHSTGAIKVVFSSDNYLQRAGFAANWTSDGTEIEDPEAVASYENVEFDLFPNPANTSVELVLPAQFKNGHLRLTDMTGRVVSDREITNEAGSAIISISEIPSGIYLVTLFNQKYISSKKLIIKH